MKKATLILLIIQFVIGIIILTGQYYYVTDACHCGPPAGMGMAGTDLLFPVLWILSIVIIIFSIIKKNWMFILFTVLLAFGVNLGRHFISIEFNKSKRQEKYNKEEIARYVGHNPENSFNANMTIIELYKDHYEIIKRIGEECGCFYLGTYLKSNDTIYFDDNIVNAKLNIHNRIFIESNDTTICPIDSYETIYIKRK
jgi:hypothetical protein